MQKSNSTQLFYKILGSGKHTILLLHGWGGSSESLNPLAKQLAAKYHSVVLIDLPGFGKSELPYDGMSLDDYAEIVENHIKHLQAKKQISPKFSVFGHSFGGSIAVKLAIRKKIKIDKLVLCNGAGIRAGNKSQGTGSSVVNKLKPIFDLPFMYTFYQSFRKLYYYYILKNRDYIDHQDKRETFKKIVREDITRVLPNVIVPTLLIWGSEDKDTPTSHAYTMRSKIGNSKLEIISGIGHGLPLKMPELVAEKIDRFLRS